MADPKLDELYRRIVGSGAVDPMALMREMMAAGVVKVAAGEGGGHGSDPVPRDGDPAAIMNAALLAAPFNLAQGPGQIPSQTQIGTGYPFGGNALDVNAYAMPASAPSGPLVWADNVPIDDDTGYDPPAPPRPAPPKGDGDSKWWDPPRVEDEGGTLDEVGRILWDPPRHPPKKSDLEFPWKDPDFLEPPWRRGGRRPWWDPPVPPPNPVGGSVSDDWEFEPPKTTWWGGLKWHLNHKQAQKLAQLLKWGGGLSALYLAAIGVGVPLALLAGLVGMGGMTIELMDFGEGVDILILPMYPPQYLIVPHSR